MYNCLRKYQFVLQASGIWPIDFNEMWKTILYHLYTAFFISFFGFVVLMRGLQGYYSKFDVELCTKSAFETVFATLLFLEIITMFFKRKEIMKLIFKLRVEFNHESGYAKELGEQCLKTENVFFYILFMVEIPGVSAEIVQTLILPSAPKDYVFNTYWNKTHPERRLPFPMPLPYDDTIEPYYEISLVLIVIEVLQGFALMCLSYTLVPMFITHTAAQFKILIHHLENLNKDGHNYSKDEKYWQSQSDLSEGKTVVQVKNELDPIFNESYIKHVNKKVNEVVVMHQDLLNTTREIIQFLQPFIFLKTVFSFGMLSVGLLTTLASGFGSPIFFVAGGLLMVAFLELFLICAYSENLTTQSMAVYDAAYRCNWYGFPDHVKKNLKMIMLRSQKPLQLNVRSNFGILNLNTFVQVIQACYSCYTVMRETFVQDK